MVFKVLKVYLSLYTFLRSHFVRELLYQEMFSLQETAVTILTQERERLSQQVQTMTSTTRQRVRARVVDTRVIGKPDQFDRDPMKYADWSFKLRSYLGDADQRYQQKLTTTETSSTPRLKESELSTQMYYILLMTTAGAALDKCDNAGVNEEFEAWEAVHDGVVRSSFERSTWDS